METKRPRVVPHRGVEGGEARLPSLLDSRRRPRVTNRPFNHECLRSFLALMGRRPSCLAANAVAGRPISWGFGDGFRSSLELESISSFALGEHTLRHPSIPSWRRFLGQLYWTRTRRARSSGSFVTRRKKEEEIRGGGGGRARPKFGTLSVLCVREIGKWANRRAWRMNYNRK